LWVEVEEGKFLDTQHKVIMEKISAIR